ncbi:MAG TPA: proton-conducting transporter membrane subunit [Candidatus Limnocylindrales bacterium]|nr:proton-conducting transporter membrane subunit [Candidatus Limnocylindrales bacterium]
MTELAVALLVPWAAGAILVALDGRRRIVGWLAVAALLGTIASLVAVAVSAPPAGALTFTTGGWPEGVGITFRADAFGLLFGLLSVGTLTAATVHEVLDGVREREFPGVVVLLAAGLTGVFLTADLFNFYVFFELALAAAYVLSVYGRTPRAIGAGLVFTAVNVVGTFVFLLSVASVYRVTGTLDMAEIGTRMARADPNAAILIAVGFFVAFGVKLGLFPFHFWLPTVYTGSRPAVAAILSGSLANIGAYGILRFGAELLPRELALASGALVVIGGASVVYGGVLAVSRRTASEMLAYSAIGQVGYVLMAIGIGGPAGFAAAILYTVINALNKTMLFLTTRIRGTLVGAVFVVGALSVAGVPPAAGFVGKLELFQAVHHEPALVVLLVVGAILSLVYAFQIYQYDHWLLGRGDEPSRWQARVVPFALAGVVLAAGLWPEPLAAFSQAAADVLAPR